LNPFHLRDFPTRGRTKEKGFVILAGLLTYSFFECPSRFFAKQWKKQYSKTFGGAYSSGSVQDLHLIPFSVSLPDGKNTTKISRQRYNFFNQFK
jgi:hypothetical protein